jgi:hypothetical protein
MAFNLANERIQDTYEQLVQISGSTLVNGIGTAIPAITNINSVSSSYAITASYAQYAVSASHEIVHEVSSSYAETASFANFATTAGTATTATTASYINPTFISASAAASGFGSGGGDPFPYTGSAAISGSLIITSSTNTGVGLDVSYTAFALLARTARITPQGFQTLNASGEVQIKIGGSTDAAQISSSYFTTDNSSVGPNNYGLWSAGRDGVIIRDRSSSPRVTLAALGDNANYPQPTVYINPRLNVDGQITASGNILMTNVNGNQTLTFTNTFTGSRNVLLRGAPDILTTFDSSGLFGADVVEASIFTMLDGYGGSHTFATNLGTTVQIKGSGSLGLRIVGGGNDPSNSTIFFTPASSVRATLKDTFFNIGVPVTGSIISASSGFIGNGSGLTNITQVGQSGFFDADDYVFDLVGDQFTTPYDIHISQSGTYFLSASSTPAGNAGPKVNLYYWPELIEVGGTAKVKFFVPSDALSQTGISFRENITGSASNQWFWNSATLSPSASTTRTITRNATFKTLGLSTAGCTTMVKDGNGRVFFLGTNASVNLSNFLYTGDSKNPLT